MSTATEQSTRPDVSERNRAANRANARKSTGPKTEQGKARSRMNALTHGLRAEQVVLPHEDADAFEAERAAFLNEWRPTTATRSVLVERLVAGAWRLRRCVRAEGARVRRIAGEVAEAFDAEIRADLDDATRRLADEPALAVDRLEGLRPGVALLRSCWEGPVALLGIEGEWKQLDRHHAVLCRLMGRHPDRSPAELGDAAMVSWTLLVTNDPSLADRSPWDDLDGELSRPYPPARAEKVRGLLLEHAEREVRRLEAQSGRLPDLGPLRDRYVEERCSDPSKEAEALQRYEGRHDRSFRANLNLLIKLSQSGADLVEAQEPNEPTGPGGTGGLPTGPIRGEPRHEGAGGQAADTTRARDAEATIEANEVAPECPPRADRSQGARAGAAVQARPAGPDLARRGGRGRPGQALTSRLIKKYR